MAPHSSTPTPTHQTIALSALDNDPKLQLGTFDGTVYQDYLERAKNGEKPPPIHTVNDGKTHWCWNGAHRVKLHQDMGWTEIEVLTIPGTKKDAALLSASANKDNGRQRTPKEKRKAVKRVLRMQQDWASRKIAQFVGVSNKFVCNVRDELVADGTLQPVQKVIGKDGKAQTAKKTPGVKFNTSDDTDDPVKVVGIGSKPTTKTTVKPAKSLKTSEAKVVVQATVGEVESALVALTTKLLQQITVDQARTALANNTHPYAKALLSCLQDHQSK